MHVQAVLGLALRLAPERSGGAAAPRGAERKSPGGDVGSGECAAGVGARKCCENFLSVLIVLYFLPGINAFQRNHKDRTAILALNILLGWSGLGWIIALVSSLKS